MGWNNENIIKGLYDDISLFLNHFYLTKSKYLYMEWDIHHVQIGFMLDQDINLLSFIKTVGINRYYLFPKLKKTFHLLLKFIKIKYSKVQLTKNKNPIDV